MQRICRFLLVPAIVLVGLTSGPTQACEEVTVRIAAFQAERNQHLLCVITDGDPEPGVMDRLDAWRNGDAAYLNLEIVHVDAGVPDVTWQEYGLPSCPPDLPVTVLVGRQGSSARQFVLDHWERVVTDDDLAVLATSPARDALKKRVVEDDAVLLYSPGDGAAKEMLTKLAADHTAETGPVSLVSFDRTDDDERVLTAFAGVGDSNEDWVAVTFARGKLLAPPLMGEDIQREHVDALLQNLEAPCTCIQDSSAMGIDLLMTWDEELDALAAPVMPALYTESVFDGTELVDAAETEPAAAAPSTEAVPPAQQKTPPPLEIPESKEEQGLLTAIGIGVAVVVLACLAWIAFIVHRARKASALEQNWRPRLSVPRMIVREVQRSRVNTLLCLVTVLFASGVIVAMVSVTRASVDSTRVLMRDMGFNLLITPENVDPARYQALDFEGGDMPEDYIGKLARSTVLAQHFVGKYQKTIDMDGMTAVLTGVLPEVPKFGTGKRPMPTAYVVPQGKVFLGAYVARALDVTPGDTVSVMGRLFEVERVNAEKGTIPDDIRVFAHLHDVQPLVGKPGRINAIDALSCYCPVDTDDIMAALEESVRKALPDVNIEPYRSILSARNEQRVMLYRLELAAVLIVVVGSATAIWGLTYQNVRNRRREIGVLRALGIPDWRIAALFVGKILAFSVLGAVAGCALGHWFAVTFNVIGRTVAPTPGLLASVLVAAPAAAVLFGLPPIVSGLMQEPTEVLRETVG
ncbi:MAG: FtsX-like permease family protein [bacterium]|nr:FtsX-like permease family protein [bacterium]